MAYSEKVIDHYENPRNVGKLETDDSVGTGVVGAPACGDVMRLQIKVEDGIITDAKFKTYGCGSAIASSSSLLPSGSRVKRWSKQARLRTLRLRRNLLSRQLRSIVPYLLKMRLKPQ
jgi:nitrogen fixation protein NifU and related proteins